MKRKSIALLLSLIMCVALLSACGANDTPDTGEPTAPVSTSTPTGQEPTDENKEQPTQEPEQEEPKEEEPEESAEPTQEEPKEEDNAGTAFLKLLQEEYKTGFVEGERPGCTYCKASNNVFAFISNGVVYIWDWDDLYNAKVFSYDIASKTLSKNEAVSTVEDGYEFRLIFAMNGTVYSNNGRSIKTFDYNGAYQKNLSVAGRLTPLCSDAGFLMLEGQVGDNILSLYSYDLEKLTEIPAPQREVEHGLKEEVDLSNFCGIASDGTVYIRTGSMGVSEPLFRLNTDTYEWENIGADSFTKRFVIEPFCGKYVVADDKIYDGVTGEEVFECINLATK